MDRTQHCSTTQPRLQCAVVELSLFLPIELIGRSPADSCEDARLGVIALLGRQAHASVCCAHLCMDCLQERRWCRARDGANVPEDFTPLPDGLHAHCSKRLRDTSPASPRVIFCTALVLRTEAKLNVDRNHMGHGKTMLYHVYSQGLSLELDG